VTTAALVEDLRVLCSGFPGAEEYVMVHHPAFRAGKKPFVVVGVGTADREPTLSINLGHLEQGELLEDPRFTRTPYIGQHGWVTIHRRDAEWDEIAGLVEGSWRRVATKKMLKAKEAL
jgi:predicted DNA-binding protein (MmcQ/YjbR family)